MNLDYGPEYERFRAEVLHDQAVPGPGLAQHAQVLVERRFQRRRRLRDAVGEALRRAQEHPELHRNLIVRVWGWSGYFCELAPEYQNHVIQRHLYQTV